MIRKDGPRWDGEAYLCADEVYGAICVSFVLPDDDDTSCILPLKDIASNTRLLMAKPSGERVVSIDWDWSVEAMQDAIGILKSWIADMEKQIELSRNGKHKPT